MNNSEVLLAGGISSLTVKAVCFVVNIITEQEREAACMLQARYSHALVRNGDLVFAIGGFKRKIRDNLSYWTTGKGPVDTVQRSNETYCTKSDTWSPMPSVPDPEGLGETSATIYKSRLLVAGSETSNLWSYHLQNKNWTIVQKNIKITGMGRSKNSLYFIFGEEEKVVEIKEQKTSIYKGKVPAGPIVPKLIENDEGSYGIARDGTVF